MKTLADAFDRFADLLTASALKQPDYFEDQDKADTIKEALESVAFAASMVADELRKGDPA